MKRVLLLLLLLGIASAPASAVVDPFYRNRMESGVSAFDQGNWEQAERQLRIACFGHLAEPVALAEGLIRLAVVEVTLGDEAAFQRTFSRLVELEERFSAYAAARVPPPVRQQFESMAARLVSAQTLGATSSFREIAERADIHRLAAMAPGERRTELETRLLAEPGQPDLLYEMARLELASRRPQAALDWLDRLPDANAEMPPATCLRQQAASESGDCGRMDLSRPFCADVPASIVEFRLQCLVDASRWPEASALVADLGPELRSLRRVTRLSRRIQKNLGSVDGTTDSTVGDTPAIAELPPTETAAAPAPPAAAEPSAQEQPVDALELARLRRLLATSATAEELADLMAEAEGFADSHPGSRQAWLLAAEVAYLRSDWPRAVRHFRQAGELRPEEAHLAFYQAVALYESGEPAAAAEVLRPVAARLERSSFVNAYVDRILGPGI